MWTDQRMTEIMRAHNEARSDEVAAWCDECMDFVAVDQEIVANARHVTDFCDQGCVMHDTESALAWARGRITCPCHGD